MFAPPSVDSGCHRGVEIVPAIGPEVLLVRRSTRISALEGGCNKYRLGGAAALSAHHASSPPAAGGPVSKVSKMF